mgnify:CR=1 FL=1
MSDIFNEIDEDIRRERYQKLWKTYGKFLILAIVVFFVFCAIYITWSNYLDNLRQREGEIFSNSLEMIENDSWETASLKLSNLYNSSTSGYRSLAKLQHASILVKNNKLDEAIIIYMDLINDEKSNQIYRDLARYFIVIHSFDTAKDSELKENLSYLLNEGNPWYYSARELEGFRLLKLGNYIDSKAIFFSLSEDIEVPSGIRMRSAEMLLYLNNL